VDPRMSNGLILEQLETRTKNSKKKSVWNSNKNSKVEPWARLCTSSCGSCHLTRKSNKLKVEPPLGTDCVRLSRVHCNYISNYLKICLMLVLFSALELCFV
jgi:hypothetical protein